MFEPLVQAVQDGVETKVIPIGGEDYTSRPVHRLPKVPIAAALKTATLQSVVDYLASSIDKADHTMLFVHVVGHDRVELARFLDSENRREVLVSAGYESNNFSFSAKYDQEVFITALQAGFEDLGDRDRLLKLVGSLSAESSLHLEDDGVSQRTTAKTGITTSMRVDPENPFELTPYRTFAEVTQPASPFILRLHKKEGSAPTISLHESDNSKWKVEAIQTIKAFFEEKQVGVPILA